MVSSGIFDVLTYDPNSSNPMAAMAVYQQVSIILCVMYMSTCPSLFIFYILIYLYGGVWTGVYIQLYVLLSKIFCICISSLITTAAITWRDFNILYIILFCISCILYIHLIQVSFYLSICPFIHSFIFLHTCIA